MPKRSVEFERYVAACAFPGVIDPEAVNSHLARYLTALGISRRVVRLEAGWELEDHPALERYVDRVLDDFAKRTGRSTAARAATAAMDATAARAARDARAATAAMDARDATAARDARAATAAMDARDATAARAARAARDARDARAARDATAARAARAAMDAMDARDARDAKRRFAAWCIQYGWGWSWYRFELSWVATTHLGALERRDVGLQRWTEPLFEAHITGAWLLHWTDDTVFWIAKPGVHTEESRGVRRMHRADGPALESDAEDLYFWHGVLVPSFVVIRPDLITVEHVERAENTEVRRVMMERFGYERYMLDSGATLVHSDEYGALYRKDFQGEQEPLLMVHVVNGTVEPDGTRHKFMLGVHPELRPILRAADEDGGPLFGEPQEMTAKAAVASTYGLRAEEYELEIRT